MGEVAASSLEAPLRFLTFSLDDRLYALAADEVSEVIRIPAAAKVPQAPKSLIGLANLRGSVLPLASLRGLLGEEAQGLKTSARAIVLDGASPAAVTVDRVEALVDVPASSVETRQAELGAQPGETLLGAFAWDGRVAKVLNVQALLSAAFVRRDRAGARTPAVVRQAAAQTEAVVQDRRMLVTFEVAGQEYALGMDAVREIIPAPETLATAPRAEALVLGVSAYRDTLLPLISLRGLLGFPVAGIGAGLQKVIVTTIGGVIVGLVADRMRAMISADPALIDAAPSVLAARTGGEAVISAIYRAEGGRRLISILEPQQLFGQDVMQRLISGGEAVASADGAAGSDAQDELRFVVFRLGDDEYGLPIAAVDEVAQIPERITRVPKTPKFLEGVVNLRGEVLPVIDQRRRFEMAKAQEGAPRRLIVVRTQDRRAGLIVDSVSEVLRSTASALEAAPDLTEDAARLVSGVINLEEAGRIILILDPDELLSGAERGLLAKFEAAAERAAL